MLARRPIYDASLCCKAQEILADQRDSYTDVLGSELLQIIGNEYKELPLLIPYDLKHLLENNNHSFDFPVFLKVDAKQVNNHIDSQQLEQDPYGIALIIEHPEQILLLPKAEIIAIKNHHFDAGKTQEIIQYCQQHHRKVIAYDIQNSLEFQHYNNLKANYYCGEFIFEPQIDESEDIAADELNFLRLLQLLNEYPCDVFELTHIIQSDPLLSYQLLKIANSAVYGGFQQIDSIEQAIMRLGLLNLKSWIMLCSMQNISNKPMEILETGLMRAHMSEKLMRNINEEMTSQAYTVGLLSILDSLLNRTMKQLLKKISLSEALKEAILNKKGILGEILALVSAYVEGDWHKVDKTQYAGQDLSQVYIECMDKVADDKRSMSSV